MTKTKNKKWGQIFFLFLSAGALGLTSCSDSSSGEANPFPFEVEFKAVKAGDGSGAVGGTLKLSKVKDDKGKDVASAEFPTAWGANGGGGYKVECYVTPTGSDEVEDDDIKAMGVGTTSGAEAVYSQADCGDTNKSITFRISQQAKLAKDDEAPDEDTKVTKYEVVVALPGDLDLEAVAGADNTASSFASAGVSRDTAYVALKWAEDVKITLDYVVFQEAASNNYATTSVTITTADKKKAGSIINVESETEDEVIEGTPQSTPFVISSVSDWSDATGPFKIADDGSTGTTDGFQINFTATAQVSASLPNGIVGSAMGVRTGTVSVEIDENN